MIFSLRTQICSFVLLKKFDRSYICTCMRFFGRVQYHKLKSKHTGGDGISRSAALASNQFRLHPKGIRSTGCPQGSTTQLRSAARFLLYGILGGIGVDIVHNNDSHGRQSITASPSVHGGLTDAVTQRPSDKPVGEQSNPQDHNPFSGTFIKLSSNLCNLNAARETSPSIVRHRSRAGMVVVRQKSLTK